jgi:hypothetical protein
MTEKKHKFLQTSLIIVLALLVIQYDTGMTVNLSKLPDISPFMFALNSIFIVLTQAGFVALIHAILGTIITIFAFIIVVMEISTKIRKIQILGVLGFINIVIAELTGIFFVLSGFQNDNFSEGMADNFILSFVFNFIVLCIIKSIASTKESKNHQESISAH